MQKAEDKKIAPERLIFLLAVHMHQPIGNFDAVFQEAYDKAYLAFIDCVKRHPQIKLSLHYSGCLLDWMEERHPEFLAKIKTLIETGQVEIMTGGYYEPLLPLIPDRDKLAQIGLLNLKVKEYFGYTPKGVWLAERVWEPNLPKIFFQAGIRYTTLDDAHFKYAGMDPERLCGFYVTEEEGFPLYIFPASEKLRYLIPFKLPRETIEYLRDFASKGNFSITFADDGEKFGLWPGTHKWVYQEKWLENFFCALEENKNWIEIMTFSEFISKYKPQGRIYLPCASYREMMEWSGGFFRNFLVKYPESNNMHKKMLLVSEKVNNSQLRTPNSELVTRAKRELYKGQCNCAYWHGVFGGLYLHHLRASVYSHLIESEKIVDGLLHPGTWLESQVLDFDKDGWLEILISSNLLNLYFDPHDGGSLFEMDYRPKQLNLINTLTRRPEEYHKKIEQLSKQTFGYLKSKVKRLTEKILEEPLSIHEIIGVKEKGLEHYLTYDSYRRTSLRDHFLEDGLTPEDFSSVRYQERGDFINRPYEYELKKMDELIKLNLWRRSCIQEDSECLRPIKIIKSIEASCDSPDLVINYGIQNLSPKSISIWFGVEFNLSLWDPNLTQLGTKVKIKELTLKDNWFGLEVKYEFDQETDVWHFPVETVSESESGMEKTYQSLGLLFRWKLEIRKEETRQLKIVQKINSVTRNSVTSNS
jgi:alpha-amylase